MRLPVAALLLASLVALTSPASGAGESYATWDTMSCGSFTFGCKATQWASVTVASCDESNCSLIVNASAIGGANVPGSHSIHVAIAGADGTDGGVCVGVPQLQEALEPLGSCANVCDAFSVGWQAGCQGVVTVNFSLPRGGSERMMDVYTIYGWNEYGGTAHPAITFFLKQASDGTVEIGACSLNLGCIKPTPPPPPRS